MSCLTTENLVEVLFKYLPPWWADNNPILDAILRGFGSIAAFIYCNLVYIKLQTRIKTATDINLDYIALDFFGNLLKRCQNESDDVFRQAILKLLLAPRVTRQAMIDRLTDLTGRTPLIYEAFEGTGNFYNHALLNSPTSTLSGNGAYQAWITAYRPLAPTQNTSVFLNNTAFETADSYYGSSGDSGSCVTDEDILNTIEITKAAGTLMHVTISD
jgi:hypothetical protein